MVQRTRKYLPRRSNMYVANMGYSVDMIHEGPYEVKFGPLAAAGQVLLNAVAMTVAGSVTTFTSDTVDPQVAATASDFPYGPGFGRTLSLVASAASTAVVTVKGTDYLGQPMTESVTLNGTTPVLGNKAFKYIDRVTWTASTANLTITAGARLGLPYRMQNVLEEMLDGVRVATLGTLVPPSYVDPQTATTSDPRGIYTPTSTLNGTALLTAVFQPNSALSALGNGGLEGIAHFPG